jgi:hypothetical protein
MLRLIGRIDQLHQLVSDARTLGFRIGFVTGRDAARRKMLSEGQPGYAAEIEHIPIPPPPPERKETT